MQVLSNGVHNVDPVVGIYEVEKIGYGETKKIFVYAMAVEGSKDFMILYNDDLEKSYGMDFVPGNFHKLNDGKYINTDRSFKYQVVINTRGLIEITINPEEYSNIKYHCLRKIYPRNLDEGPYSQGTGFVISKDGWIVTNRHVIDMATRIRVLINKNGLFKEYECKQLSYDYENDLALIRIDYFTNKPICISSVLEEIGNKVYALGYPKENLMGRQLKITDGIINSTSGIIGNQDFYQFSAPIQPGNSGGPLLNNKGNLCGVVTSKLKDGEMVSYAIKSGLLKRVVKNYNTEPTNENYIRLEQCKGKPMNASMIYKECSSSVVLIYVD
jgi:S1-C subfamily serine protease